MELTERDKKVLLIGGMTALGIAILFWLLSRNTTVVAGPAAVTDQPTATGDTLPPVKTPNMYTYNIQPLYPEALGMPPPSSASDGGCGCGCGSPFGGACYGGNQLGTGYTYSNLGQYLNFLQDTNPNFVQLYGEMMSTYAGSIAINQSNTIP